MKLRFTYQQRLLTPKDYKQVFEQPAARFKSQHFLLLIRPNQLDKARLGLVIAKKQIKKASVRNTVKRISRETFRLRQHELKGYDIVFLAYHSLGTLTKAEISKCLNDYWLKVTRYCNGC